MTTVLQRFEETETVGCGGFGALECDYGNLPLKQLNYHTHVIGLGLRSSIIQTFYNPFDEPIEANYIFPIEGNQAVVGCEMRVANRVVRAKLKERGQARADYRRAISSGHRAALLEENRPETFSMKVGNIPPGEAVQVRIETVAQLPVVHGEWTLRIPLVVAPRYTSGIALPGNNRGSGIANDTDQVPDASTVTPATWLPGFASPVELKLSVHLDLGNLASKNWLRDLRSSLHAIAVESGVVDTPQSGCKIRILPGERVNRDFVLRGRVDDSQISTAVTVEADRSSADSSDDNRQACFAIHLVPPRVDHQAPRDVVFLLDHSGSMDGWKMKAAKRGISRLVDSLNGNDRFQVIAFSDSVSKFGNGHLSFGKPCSWRDANDVNRYEAVSWLSKIESSGGTEMCRAVLEGLKGFTSHDDQSRRSPAMVLVTDGQITSEDAVLRAIGNIPKGVRPRIYCLGIDRAVNGSVLQRITNFTGGTYELVESENRLSEVLQRFGTEIGCPVIRDLSVEVDSLSDSQLAPNNSCTLYQGRSLTIYGRTNANGVKNIRLNGLLSNGDQWSQRIEATITENAEPVIRPLWGKSRVRELEDKLVAGGNRDAELIGEIIDCSLRCQVLSRLTAFVAVDESEVVTDGRKPHSVSHPSEMPEGWSTSPTRLRSDSLVRVPRSSYSEGDSFEITGINDKDSEQIVEYLLRKQIISSEQLGHANSVSGRDRVSPVDALVKLQYVSNERVAMSVAELANMNYVDPLSIRILDEVIQLVPESVARENRILPIQEIGRTLVVLVSDPNDLEKVEGLRFILDRDVVAHVASKPKIMEAINRYYGYNEGESADSMLQEFTNTQISFAQIDFTETEEDELLLVDDDEDCYSTGALMAAPEEQPLQDDDICLAQDPIIDLSSQVSSFAFSPPSFPKFRKGPSYSSSDGNSAPMVRLVHYMIAEAVQLRASHILVEKRQDRVEIRYVINGNLVERDNPPKRLYRSMIVRLKTLAKIDISETNDIQSGNIHITVGDRDFNLKIFIAPDAVLLEFETGVQPTDLLQPVKDWWDKYGKK